MKIKRLLTIVVTSLSLLALTGCSEEFKINDISFDIPSDCKVETETEYTSLGNYVSFSADGIYFSLKYEYIDEGKNEDTVFKEYDETMEYNDSYEKSEIFYIDGVKIVKYKSASTINDLVYMSEDYCFCYNDVFYEFSVLETCEKYDEEIYNNERYKKVREVIDTLTFN